jgi:hypothetical protein
MHVPGVLPGGTAPDTLALCAWPAPAGETVERIVSFQPPIPGPQSMTITAKTLAGRTFTLDASALGVTPGLSISHNKVRGLPVRFMRSG